VRLPGIDSDFPALDREPISRDSDSTVQLVIFGDSPQTDALAINAALVAHYPNYCRDPRLRTRITIVDDHEQGLIHFHDADYFAQHMHNCCLVNLEDMLQNGTVISETMIEKPHSFSTACNIATQATCTDCKFPVRRTEYQSCPSCTVCTGQPGKIYQAGS